MSRLTGRIYTLASMFGVDTRKTIRTLKGLPAYFADLKTIKRQYAAADARFPFGRPVPCLDDRFVPGGSASGHYFHQDLLVARRIFENKPDVHMDVGSRVDGFVAHVAAFRPIVVLDIRPLISKIPNIEFIRADLMSRPPDDLLESCDSLSCLHALEHFGLGRYGDPVRYDGHLLGLQNLHSLLRTGGKFYLSVPIGPQRIEFNAQRVFSVAYLLQCVADRYLIDRFSFVDDKGDLHEHVALNPDDVEHDFGCHNGCGIVEMTKR